MADHFSEEEYTYTDASSSETRAPVAVARRRAVSAPVAVSKYGGGAPVAAKRMPERPKAAAPKAARRPASPKAGGPPPARGSVGAAPPPKAKAKKQKKAAKAAKKVRRPDAARSSREEGAGVAEARRGPEVAAEPRPERPRLEETSVLHTRPWNP